MRNDESPLRPIRPAPFFVADSRALDFLNSTASPFGERIEWVANGEDLLGWLETAGLMTAEDSTEVRSRALPAELDLVAAQARALREWFRGFVTTHKGAPLSVNSLKDLAPLNDLLARDQTHLSVRLCTQPDSAFALETVRQRLWATPASLLFPLAEAMAALVTSGDFCQVKKCEAPKCTILMLDTTQRHARRWCSMGLCGNRAKQAAHRNRLNKI